MRQFKRNCLDHNQTRLKPKTFPKYDVSFLISSSHGNIEALFFTKEKNHVQTPKRLTHKKDEN